MTDALGGVFARAQRLGFLGPGPVDRHLEHAAAFAAAARRPPLRALDLGTGAGIPGLVLAQRWPASEWVLLDARRRRTVFLAEAIRELGWADRVRVEDRRAELAGRDPALRGRCGLVVARGFGPPAVTLECGLAFLAPDGDLLVSEPPTLDPDRWPAAALVGLGVRDDGVKEGDHAHIRRLRATAPVPDEVPRSVGIPAKRPWW